VRRCLVWIALIVIGIGTSVAGLGDEETFVLYESCSLWMADSQFVGNHGTHKGDADMTGLMIGLESQNYWTEWCFAAGKRTYATASDTYNFRNACGIGGLRSEHVDLGLGIDWQAHTWSNSSVHLWGLLGSVRLRHPLSEAGLDGCLSASLCPLCVGENLGRYEYAQLSLCATYASSRVLIEVGYRCRWYYRVASELSYYGPFINLGLGLEI